MRFLTCASLILVGQILLNSSVFAATADIFAQAKNNYIQRIESHPPMASVDEDFANFLLPQHLSGVELSRIELAKGHNATLRAIASGIVAHSDRNQPVTTSTHGAVSPATSNAVIAALATADSHAREAFQTPSAAAVDEEFARLMDAHHLRAMAYAREEISDGQDARLVHMAQAILSTQTKQHHEMMPLAQ